jgi:hypothetical protein
LSDEELTTRVKCKTGVLFPIRDEAGEIFGKVGALESDYDGPSGAITYHGVRSGSLSGLIGVIESRDNNADAKRVDATFPGSETSWRDWAQRVVNAGQANSMDLQLRLHPLLPHQDFPVWTMGGQVHSLMQVCKILGTRSEVVIYEGHLSRRDDDNMSDTRFTSSFRAIPELVVLPSFQPPYHTLFAPVSESGNFPWNVGAKPIDYPEVFKAELAKVWSDFELDDDIACVVGHADGVEVTRRVTRYFRK